MKRRVIIAAFICTTFLVGINNTVAMTCVDLMKEIMPMPKDIVKKQLEAFNNQDIEGCLKYFAEDLKVIVLPEETVIASSKEEIRQHMKDQIDSGDFLPAKLIDISSNGKFVTTTEVKDDGKVKSTITFIYYVEDGLIKKMWGAPFREDSTN